MSTQRQIQPSPKSKRSSWKLLRMILAITTILLIGAGTTIAIFRSTLFNAASIIFTATGAAFALCQWLLPVSHTQSNHPMPSISQSSVPSIIVQLASRQLDSNPEASPPTKNMNYRGIVGLPPPTEPRTIHQREKDVCEVYTQLTQSDVTAVALTGIGGVGKSTLAALVFRYSEVQRQLNQDERALEHFELALSAHRDAGNRRGEGWTLSNLGGIHYREKEKEQALKCFEQALSICKEIGDQWGEGVALGNLGKVYLDSGQHEEARKYFEQALVFSKEVGNREGESRMLDFLDRSRSES